MKPPQHLWGVDAPVTLLPGGHRNAVWRTTGLRRDLVFKTTRRSAAAIDWLAPVLDRAEAAGFAVARPLKSLSGRFLEDGWTAEPFLRGTAMPGSDMTALHPLIKDFHRRCAGIGQRPGFLASRDLCFAAAGGDVDLETMPAPLVKACRAAWAGMPIARSVIHGDFIANNVILTEAGPALIDWDEARVDAPCFDLGGDSPDQRRALLTWEVACCWQIEPARARDLARRLLTS